MVKTRVLPAFMIILLVSAANIASAQPQGFQEIWSLPGEVIDLDVSRDGNYIAMINSTGVYYFASGNRVPLWWLPSGGSLLYQVAISGNGEHLVVLFENLGDGVIGFAYIDANPGVKWYFFLNGTFYQSNQHGRLIDISDDGEYVVAALNNITSGAPTYESFLVYFSESTTREYPDPLTELSDATWYRNFTENNEAITCLDMNSMGSTVAIGTREIEFNLNQNFILFFPDAQSQTGENEEASGITGLTSEVMDISVADFGHAVGAVTIGTYDYPDEETLYFWDDVRPLIAESHANWTRQHEFGCVDLSGDGDRVMAGAPSVAPCGIHYWAGALTREGGDEPETWTEHEGEHIPDIAISDDGEVIAATAIVENFETEYWVYIYDSEENDLGSFQVGPGDTVLEMSGDGRVVAVGGGQEFSLHVYQVPEIKPVGGEILPYNMTLIGVSYLLIALTIVTGTLLSTKKIFHSE